jgi:hypothetical protein
MPAKAWLCGDAVFAPADDGLALAPVAAEIDLSGLPHLLYVTIEAVGGRPGYTRFAARSRHGAAAAISPREFMKIRDRYARILAAPFAWRVSEGAAYRLYDPLLTKPREWGDVLAAMTAQAGTAA